MTEQNPMDTGMNTMIQEMAEIRLLHGNMAEQRTISFRNQFLLTVESKEPLLSGMPMRTPMSVLDLT